MRLVIAAELDPIIPHRRRGSSQLIGSAAAHGSPGSAKKKSIVSMQMQIRVAIALRYAVLCPIQSRQSPIPNPLENRDDGRVSGGA